MSLLDDFDGEMAWIPSQTVAGSWMQIDAGENMNILGIITQGRGAPYTSHYVTEFTVEYQLVDILGTRIALLEKFNMTDSSKKEHLFKTPVYARYIRIIVSKWHSAVIAMRAALVIKSCSTCLATSISVQGSMLESDCTCPSGGYKYSSIVDRRAIALVPGRAQLSTLANR